MSQTTQIQQPDGAATAIAPRRQRAKTPIVYAALAVIAAALLPQSPGGTSTFRISTESDLIQLPDIAFPVFATNLIAAVLLLCAAGYVIVRSRAAEESDRTIPLWFNTLAAIIVMIDLLVWAAAGQTLPFTGLLTGTITLSAPLIFGALGGVISERVGVVNIAIEGQLLAGAFMSAVVASVTHSQLAGLIAAMVAGTLVSFLLATFTIRYLVDQVIVGVVVNVLVLGLTNFLFSQVLAKNPETLNSPERLEKLPIPLLSQIPLVGPVLFRQTIIIYIMYAVVGLVFYGLFFTKWGLRVRAVGEHPQAADTVGINVNRTRFWNVALAGAIAGLGGSFFTLGSVGGFQKEMTAGLGFIALAAVIFGRWDPIRATLAALLFGFATNLQNVLGIIGSPVPSEFMLMLPYIVTIFAVAGFVGKVRGPAAAGKPYVQG